MFEYKKAGDMVIATGENFEFHKAGDLYKFKFNGKVTSRRLVRCAIKEIDKAINGKIGE